MRIVTYLNGGVSEPGLLIGERIVPASAFKHEYKFMSTVQLALTLKESRFDLSDVPQPARTFPKDSVKLLSPVINPNSIRDFYAFEEHVRNARRRRGLDMEPTWYEFPVFYYSNHTAIYSPGDEIPYPRYTSKLDYELEVACVIGKKGIDIPVENAREYIAGYMLFNDWSARDIQAKEMRIGLGPAKSKDFAKSMGPYLVTPDEFDHTHGKGPDVELTASVNGTLYSKGNLKDLYWSFEEMIARASQEVFLYPGDVIASGTVGSGCILELGGDEKGWLKVGDVVTFEGGPMGVLSNRVGNKRS
ncbi:MAG: fumarylacetoacetate hydrolase family protein [Thermoprotei archaeon]